LRSTTPIITPPFEPEDYAPPSLTLVLPGDLGKDETVQRLAQAIGQVRITLDQRAQLMERRVRARETEGNKLGQALCRGHVLANHAAAATIDEAITEVFDLWSQLGP
jgi:hypothetical protein